jgi:multidrug efflux pump subunit AcrA (membrane-fusion protein)
MSSDDSLAKAEELLARLEATRAELETLSDANDADRALEVLGELADLGRQVEEELQRAKRRAEEETDAQR